MTLTAPRRHASDSSTRISHRDLVRFTNESGEMLLGYPKQVHTQSRSIREDTMDQVPAGGTSRDISSDTVRARRGRMRAQARGRRPAASPETDGFQTPQWLERSFVLPLSEPEVTDVPSQPVPHHDDYETPGDPAPEAVEDASGTFVRPPTREIDFARVIKRSDQGRTATRTALGAIGISGLLLIAYLLAGSPVVLGMTLAFALIALVAVGVRLRLATAAIPHVDR